MSDPMEVSPDASDEAVREAIRANPLWYHTIELRPGVVTPGWFDLRPIADRLPWPDVRGKRCLDIGTYDGYLAFELERRGAAEVMATDVSDHDRWDWPVRVRQSGPARLANLAGEKGRGFGIAAAALGSRVKKIDVSVYDLSADEIGRFDVVVCGSLLLHLRDPLRALEAIRGVCSGVFLSSEEIDSLFSIVHRRTPLTKLNGLSLMQWHVPNVAGHRRMIVSSGFDIVREVRPYAIRFGNSHPPLGRGPRSIAKRVVTRALCGAVGVPHSAVLCRPV